MGIIAGTYASKLQALDFSLRLLVVVPFSIASIAVTVTTKQVNTAYGTLEFDNLVGLKYMVCISAISAGYALMAALASRLKWVVDKPWLFFVTDQMIAYLMVTSMAAQGEFVYLAFNGDRAVTWSQGCASYARLCRQVLVGLALHVVPVCCFLCLAVISAYRVFIRFDPPASLPDHHTHN